MPLRLPPLPALRFFEAAGRHQSFKLAAAELNVTPSAVSHGIVGLEETLGVELFVREPRGISLTATGADYLSYVSEAFSLIYSALTFAYRLCHDDCREGLSFAGPVAGYRFLSVCQGGR